MCDLKCWKARDRETDKFKSMRKEDKARERESAS